MYQATGAAEDRHHVNFSFKRSCLHQRWTIEPLAAVNHNIFSEAQRLPLSTARYQSDSFSYLPADRHLPVKLRNSQGRSFRFVNLK